MEDSPKRGFFEWFTQLLVPLAALVATIAVIFQQKPRTIALSLIGVAFLSLLISEGPKANRSFKQWKVRRRQQAVSATAFEDLKGRIHKFEQLASTRRNDTLYLIVYNNLCQSSPADFDNLHLVPPLLFFEFWEHLRNRVDATKPSSVALGATILEFNSFVGHYCRYLACPLYDRMPSKLSPEMLNVYIRQGVEKDLIQFRERFVRFLDDYEDFLKETDRRLPFPLNAGYYFERPKPLTLLGMQTQASLSVG
jgi:hypothetical protein